MGNPLFGIDISKLIHDNISPGVLAATLVKRANTARTPGSLSGGLNPSSTSYSCRGFIDSKQKRFIDGTLVTDGAENIVLIGDSIVGAVPEIGDRVTIEGRTFVVEQLDRDPAAAVYTLSCKQV